MKAFFAGIGTSVLLAMIVSRYGRSRPSLQDVAADLQQHFPHTSANTNEASAA
jgi:hypothetical protein